LGQCFDQSVIGAVVPGWNGLWTPLGYDVRNRKLIVNETEAGLVRSIFERFAEGVQPARLIDHLRNESSLNKQGKPIDKGHLYRVLNNRVYLGEAVHKGQAYPGEHEPIISATLWDRVHRLIAPNHRDRSKRRVGNTPALLKGLIFAPDGSAMTPTFTRKKGKLYRYYTSVALIRTGATELSKPIRRIPAAQIETAVVVQMRALLQSPEIIVATWRKARQTDPKIREREVADQLRRFDDLWAELFPVEQARIVHLLVERVVISEKGADISLRVEGLSSVLDQMRSPQAQDAA
jgi:site-specific DNA recombinase